MISKVSLQDTDFFKLDEIKKEFDKIYEEEKKKKDFEKYVVYNKYAKLKKRKRNFYIDKSEHYDVIIDESTEGASSGFLKLLVFVGFISVIVIVIMKTKEHSSGRTLFETEEHDKTENGKKGALPAQKKKQGSK